MSVFKIFGSGTGKRSRALTAEDECNLMKKIKTAEDISAVDDEFGLLYDSLYRKLWGKLYKRFSTELDIDDLQDAFQEGWRKVLESRSSYMEGSNVYNWIYTILKNTAFDISRKEKKFLNEVEFFEKKNVKNENDGNDDEGMFSILSTDEKNIEDEIDEREVIQIIYDVINGIEDATDREMLKKRVYEGAKFNEIAEEFDIPVATVHYRINQTMNKIKPKLKKLLEL
jgi:RNA polymerase sigma-70 factor (ECF subfamily)